MVSMRIEEMGAAETLDIDWAGLHHDARWDRASSAKKRVIFWIRNAGGPKLWAGLLARADYGSSGKLPVLCSLSSHNHKPFFFF